MISTVSFVVAHEGCSTGQQESGDEDLMRRKHDIDRRGQMTDRMGSPPSDAAAPPLVSGTPKNQAYMVNRDIGGPLPRTGSAPRKAPQVVPNSRNRVVPKPRNQVVPKGRNRVGPIRRNSAATHRLVNMSSQLLLVHADRAGELFGCILSHGVALLVWFVGSVVTAILPDRGHRLQKCETNVTSSEHLMLLSPDIEASNDGPLHDI